MQKAVTRKDFIVKLMHNAGLSYDQACRAYTCMTSIIEDAVVTETKVGIGKVGVLVPVRRPARPITMGFKRLANGEIEKTRRQFFINERTIWSFRIHNAFKSQTC